MQISEIYSKYKTLPNLQRHMLRVSAVAKIVLDNWTGVEVNNESILQTCLLHDIAKPITFDMNKQVQYVKNTKELNEIENCNKFLINNYGTKEHPALLKIGIEIGLNHKTLKLLDNLEWYLINELLEKNEIESLIPIYCDMRISPNGIVTIEQRIQDLKNRTGKDIQQQYKDGKNLERFINQNISIDLNKISNQKIEKIADKLIFYEL